MKIVSIVGARPQFIKVAPILRSINTHNRGQSAPIEHMLIHTGQHYDYELSQAFFVDLDLPKPDYNLGIGSGSHGQQTGEMLKQIEQVLLKEKPPLVLVYGDTNSTLAAALAAIKLHIVVAHVEAGLREYDKKIPEEVNRLVAGQVSTLLFCPSRVAVENLRREGFENVAFNGELAPLDGLDSLPPFDLDHPLVINTGDVMYDSVLHNLKLAEKRSNILKRLHLQPKGYALATVHRAENTDDPNHLVNIFSAFDQLAQEGLKVILPLHPRTRKALASVPQGDKLVRNVEVIAPVSYKDMLILEKNAQVILTDSGGMQKEAYWFRVPCVTLRELTGWAETVEAGWNHLVGWKAEHIVKAVHEAKPGDTYEDFYGDGQATERIVETTAQRKVLELNRKRS